MKGWAFLGGGGQWYADKHGRAPLFTGLDAEMSVDQGSSFLHSQQPQPLAAALFIDCRREIESDAVILDDRDHLVRSPLDNHADARRSGMLDDVVQRLLHNPVNRRFDVRRQPLALPARAVKID